MLSIKVVLIFGFLIFFNAISCQLNDTSNGNQTNDKNIEKVYDVNLYITIPTIFVVLVMISCVVFCCCCAMSGTPSTQESVSANPVIVYNTGIASQHIQSKPQLDSKSSLDPNANQNKFNRFSNRMNTPYSRSPLMKRLTKSDGFQSKTTQRSVFNESSSQASNASNASLKSAEQKTKSITKEDIKSSTPSMTSTASLQKKSDQVKVEVINEIPNNADQSQKSVSPKNVINKTLSKEKQLSIPECYDSFLKKD